MDKFLFYELYCINQTNAIKSIVILHLQIIEVAMCLGKN